MKKIITYIFLLFVAVQPILAHNGDPKEVVNPISGEVSIYPNPILDNATINFTLSKSAAVTVEIFSLIGQKVATIAKSQVFALGQNTININKDELNLTTSSLYIMSVTCEGKTKNYKIFVK